MKKLFAVILLASSISISALAGDQPTGNKTCPTSAPCLTGDIPTGNVASESGDISILETIKKYLGGIFG